MYLSTLKLTDVRQFEHRTFEFSPGFNILVGVNGAGKTTVLRGLLAAIGGTERGYSRLKLEDEDIRLLKQRALVEAVVQCSHGRKEKYFFEKPLWRRANRSPLRNDRPLVLFYGSNEALCSSLTSKRTKQIRNSKYEMMRLDEKFLYYREGREYPEALFEQHDSRFGNSRLVRSFVGKVLSSFAQDFQGFYWRIEPYSCSLTPPKKLDKEFHLDADLQKLVRVVALRFFQEDSESWFDRLHGWPDQESVTLGEKSAMNPWTEKIYLRLRNVWDKMDLPSDAKQILKESNLEVKLTPRIMIVLPVGPLSLSQLSDGEQRLFSLFVDIARQLSLQNSEGDIGNGEAIVLIDEIDVHLHPKWQRKIVPALEDLFPNCQFIATTHSPFVIQSVRSESNLLLLDGHPLEQLGNTGIEKISQVIMDVDRPDVSDRYVSEVKLAKSFLQLLDQAEKSPEEKLEDYVNRLRHKLDHAQNPAMQAFLELQQESRLGD